MSVVQINGCDRLVDEDGFYLELTDFDEGLLLLLVGNPEDPTAGIDLTPAAACVLGVALHIWAITRAADTPRAETIHGLADPLGRILIGVSTSIVRAYRLCRRFARIL